MPTNAPKPPKRPQPQVRPTVVKKENFVDKVKKLADKYIPKHEPTDGEKLNQAFPFNPLKRIPKTTWFNASNSSTVTPMSAYERWKAKRNQATNDGGG